MKYTKKCAVWLILAALVFSLMFTGCGKEETAAESAEEQTAAEASDEAEAAEETTETVDIESDTEGEIVSVTLLVNEDEDGTQSVAGAAVEYSAEIDASSLSVSDYSVMSGNTEYYVSDIYTNSEAAFADGSEEGCFVILELTQDASAVEAESAEEPDGPVAAEDAIVAEEIDGEGPSQAEDEPEVTPYAIDGEEETDAIGPENWDPNDEVVLNSSPAEEASGEVSETDAEAADDTLSITVIQEDWISTVDQAEISPAPAEYESTAIVVV